MFQFLFWHLLSLELFLHSLWVLHFLLVYLSLRMECCLVFLHRFKLLRLIQSELNMLVLRLHSQLRLLWVLLIVEMCWMAQSKAYLVLMDMKDQFDECVQMVCWVRVWISVLLFSLHLYRILVSMVFLLWMQSSHHLILVWMDWMLLTQSLLSFLMDWAWIRILVWFLVREKYWVIVLLILWVLQTLVEVLRLW